MKLQHGARKMNAMTNPIAPSIDAVIAAAGMTSFAAECDVIVLKRTPHVAKPFEPASEVVPPFPGD